MKGRLIERTSSSIDDNREGPALTTLVLDARFFAAELANHLCTRGFTQTLQKQPSFTQFYGWRRIFARLAK